MTNIDWTEPDPQILDEITQHGCFAADHAVISGDRETTPAEQTRVAVRAALRLLLANGIITVAPQSDWPQWVALEPPVDNGPGVATGERDPGPTCPDCYGTGDLDGVRGEGQCPTCRGVGTLLRA